jgi:hypothetical protein
MRIDTDKVTRVEVIDETGRVFSRWNTKVDLSFQDGGKTLKIFVEAELPKRDIRSIRTGMKD